MTTQVWRLAAHKDASSTIRILAHTVSDPQVRDLQEAPYPDALIFQSHR
jgi:hypothetical protein